MVYLVGAGPGHPGCLTLRGRECLERADVVIYDQLANPAFLRLAPRGALRIFAGKHGAGPHLLEQAAINDLLVEHARHGRVVVRLKGGDPFVFGRGGEEAEALAAAGIAFEVVPGVTSALAVPAFAGIPVTHRDWVSGVTVLTGHETPEKPSSRVRWREIARAGNTIVLLMGVTQLRANLAALLEAGLDRSTPAAAIRWGGTARQRVVETTIGALADAVEAARLRPPVTVVVGDVVRLRSTMAWLERRPLFGQRIVVTRTRGQAGELARRLADAGAWPIEIPAIEIVPADPAPLDAAVDHLAEFGWAIFTSVNGVEVFLSRMSARRIDRRRLTGVRLAAIGPATAEALAAAGLYAEVVASEHRAEGLIAALGDAEVRGTRVLLPRADGARAVLPDALRARGAQVVEVITYASVRPSESVEILRSILAEGAREMLAPAGDAGHGSAGLAVEINGLTFTSSSTVTGFLGLLDEADPEHGRSRIAGCRVACIGPITAETARAAGLGVDLVAPRYTIPDLADAIIGAWGNSG